MRADCGVFMFVILIVPALCANTKGFIENPKDGRGYKVMYNSQSWTSARDSCVDIGAKLAVPKSEEQFGFLQNLVRNMHYPSIVGTRYKLLVWLGISNKDTNGTWKNIDGENIEDTGFHTWAGQLNGMPSKDPREPHCVGMDASNIGLRDWWCDHPQPFICEI